MPSMELAPRSVSGPRCRWPSCWSRAWSVRSFVLEYHVLVGLGEGPKVGASGWSILVYFSAVCCCGITQPTGSCSSANAFAVIVVQRLVLPFSTIRMPRSARSQHNWSYQANSVQNGIPRWSKHSGIRRWSVVLRWKSELRDHVYPWWVWQKRA